MAIEKIYVMCDACNTAVYSGLSVALNNLEQSKNQLRNNQTKCSACGHLILWSKAELWPESLAKTKNG
jgi:hypothetical protein